MEIEDNREQFDHIQRESEELSRLSIEVGIFAGAGDDNFYAMIANVHEFGMTIHAKNKYLTIPTKHAEGRKASEIEGLFKLPGKDVLVTSDKGEITVMFILKESVNIPERSFLRSSFDEKNDEWYEFLRERIDRIIDGDMTAERLFEQLGAKIASDIQKKMTDVRSPKNAGLTAENKKSDNPLMDTGELRRRVTWKVVRDD